MRNFFALVRCLSFQVFTIFGPLVTKSRDICQFSSKLSIILRSEGRYCDIYALAFKLVFVRWMTSFSQEFLILRYYFGRNLRVKSRCGAKLHSWRREGEGWPLPETIGIEKFHDDVDFEYWSRVHSLVDNNSASHLRTLQNHNQKKLTRFNVHLETCVTITQNQTTTPQHPSTN